MPDNIENIRRIASFLWEVAQDLHGAVAKSENQNIILPLTVLRRLDYALAPTKAKVLEAEDKLKAKGLENRHDALCRAAGFAFYNIRHFTAWRETPHLKIFPSTAFGYRRIQIDRPLRLNFEASEERLGRLTRAKAFAELATSKKKDPDDREAEILAGREFQSELLAALRALPAGLVKCQAAFDQSLTAAFKRAGLKPKKTLHNAILDALSERDETAEPVIAEQTASLRSEIEARAKRHPRPGQAPETPRFGHFILDHPDRPELARLVRYQSDNDLKDFENVPLGTAIVDYFEREVLPHAADAWINPDFKDEKDHQTGKVGYEINFNRHFYTYQPPRPVTAIDEDIRKVEKNILGMLKEVMG